MSSQLPQPSGQRNVDDVDKDANMQVFERSVLEYSDKRNSDEDSPYAPLPESYPYRTRMRRIVYEKEKTKLQIELLKVQSWVNCGFV